MQISHVASVAAIALVVLVAPTSVLAAPTASQITAPANAAIINFDSEQPSSLHVTGTTSGGTGNVDLRCYFGSESIPVAAAVTVTNNAFAVDVPLTIGLFHNLDSNYCVLRAVPAGTTPSATPGQPSAFEGPEIAVSGVERDRLGPGGAPNAADTLYDYGWQGVQKRAYSAYYSAGSCGICETTLFDPVTLALSSQIWYEGAAMFTAAPGNSPTRSGVQVDGVDVYLPAGAHYIAGLANNPGFPALQLSSSLDPVTGDSRLVETDPAVACTPQPATYPPSDATCPAFAPPKVTLERTIVQDHQGLQVTITDRWHSNDAQPHALDAYYWEGTASEHSTEVNRYDFSWTGAGFTTYPSGSDIVPPPTAPASVYVQVDSTTPESGDGKNPFGAITYKTAPSAIQMVHGYTQNAPGYTAWAARYQRTIPASGDLVIEQVYSHDYSLAGVKALERGSDPAASGDSTPPPAPPVESQAPPAAIPAPAPAAVPAKCVVPKLRGRTLRSAKRLLRRNHCRVGKITRVPAKRMRPGRVLATKPRPGARRAAGTRIALRVARSR
jgi:PASTA domain-containing protein